MNDKKICEEIQFHVRSMSVNSCSCFISLHFRIIMFSLVFDFLVVHDEGHIFFSIQLIVLIDNKIEIFPF